MSGGSSRHALPVQLQQISLPRRQKNAASTFVGSDGIQRAARRYKRRLEAVLICDCVPAPPQRFGRLLHLLSRTRPDPAAANGPGGFRQVQRLFGRIAKCLAAARRKMAKVGSFTRGKSLRGLQQQVVLQNVERGPIRSLCLLFAPLPKLA